MELPHDLFFADAMLTAWPTHPDGAPCGAMRDVWHHAHAEASDALADWRRQGGKSAFARYRAAQDLEDAAQEAYAAAVAASSATR